MEAKVKCPECQSTATRTLRILDYREKIFKGAVPVMPEAKINTVHVSDAPIKFLYNNQYEDSFTVAIDTLPRIISLRDDAIWLGRCWLPDHNPEYYILTTEGYRKLEVGESDFIETARQLCEVVSC